MCHSVWLNIREKLLLNRFGLSINQDTCTDSLQDNTGTDEGQLIWDSDDSYSLGKNDFQNWITWYKYIGKTV